MILTEAESSMNDIVSMYQQYQDAGNEIPEKEEQEQQYAAIEY
jgi:hypothetical protein